MDYLWIFFQVCGDFKKNGCVDYWNLLNMFEVNKIYMIMVRLHFDDIWVTLDFIYLFIYLMIFEMI